MSDIELQFQPIAMQYGALEEDAEKSRYELGVNWPSILAMLPPPPARVLDYGCGSGAYSRMLLKMGYDVLATDNAPDMISQLADIKDRALVWSYRDDPLPEKFDAIIAKLVVQLVDDLPKFLEVMHRQLEPKGHLIISIPNPERSRRLLADDDAKSYLTKIGESDLEVTMIHRELAEFQAVGQTKGFMLRDAVYSVDPENATAESKRLNMLFEAV